MSSSPVAVAYIDGVESEIVIGMGATEFLPDERVAYTVFAITSPTRIVLKRDSVTTNPDGSVSCAYDREAPKVVVTKREDNRWRKNGVLLGGPTFGFGQRQSGPREQAA